MKTLIQLAILITALAWQTSFAAVKSSNPAPDKVVITYAQADLNSSVGRQRIEAEIRRAAKDVCDQRHYSHTRSLSYANKTRACYRTKVLDALQQLDEGNLVVKIH